MGSANVYHGANKRTKLRRQTRDQNAEARIRTGIRASTYDAMRAAGEQNKRAFFRKVRADVMSGEHAQRTARIEPDLRSRRPKPTLPALNLPPMPDED